MQITIVLQHADQRESAGVRIRYDRIAAHLDRMGHGLNLVLIDDMHLRTRAKSDVYLFCKCQDIRSILLAEALSAQGRRVGIDLFDDYFSQIGDDRFTHMREWLHRITQHIGFVLCATDVMRARLAAFCPKLPSLVMNDPCNRFDTASLAETLAGRIETARRTARVKVAWFGVGDNPHFPVGLDDLSAMGESLAGFRRHGFEPQLHVLTNRRAMTPERLARLKRLPLPVRLGEWTEEKETALLRSSLLAYLPVNAQPFSTAKSLNRAVTALSNGAQVLSAGYPLYARLDPFVYRTVDELAADLARGEMKLSPETLPSLGALFDVLATPETEAKRLVTFLEAVRVPVRAKTDNARPVVVLHGVGNAALQHKYLQRSRLFSAAGPFQDGKLNFDLRFEAEIDGRMAVILSKRLAGLLEPALAARLAPYQTTQLISFMKLSLDDASGFGPAARCLADKLAGYETVMEAAQAVIARIVPGARIVHSETSAAFQLRAARHAAEQSNVDA